MRRSTLLGGFSVSRSSRVDVPVYHPDVRVWEVSDAEGRHVGLFLGDYFARSSKRSGAWMSQFRSQEKLEGDIRPIVTNVLNFSKGGDGQPTLISFEDARTLFHEFGHGLHGLLSDVTYRAISGTNVATTSSSSLAAFEHWLEEPELLRRFALHYQTGEPMPEAMLKRMLSARNFNQGFATVEYTPARWSSRPASPRRGRGSGHRRIRAGVAQAHRHARGDRHAPPADAVRHLFTGDHYAAGYYSYLWSEVLDADGFAAFKEAGDIFDPATAKRLKEFVYSPGISASRRRRIRNSAGACLSWMR